MQNIHQLSIIHPSAMTKRKKGQIPYESAHPVRIEMPDVPGHQQGAGRKGARVVVNEETKELLDAQIKRLKADLNIDQESQGSSESKG